MEPKMPCMKEYARLIVVIWAGHKQGMVNASEYQASG